MTVDGTRTGMAPAPTGPLSKIDYSERIPNNVNLSEDRRLQRALERMATEVSGMVAVARA